MLSAAGQRLEKIDTLASILSGAPTDRDKTLVNVCDTKTVVDREHLLGATETRSRVGYGAPLLGLRLFVFSETKQLLAKQ